ncbi:MAG: transposase [Deltaproteobacteria bacterium]|nr:transposase [Deltaproteobacteria bacterium]
MSGSTRRKRGAYKKYSAEERRLISREPLETSVHETARKHGIAQANVQRWVAQARLGSGRSLGEGSLGEGSLGEEGKGSAST